MADGVTRRDWLAATTVGLGGAIVASSLQASPEQGEATVANSSGPFRVCFNTSTIRGQKLTVDKQIAIAIQAGYEGIEPWIGDLRAFVEGGGKLSDLRKQLDDGNLKVESAIGFARWIVDDEGQRKAGLEELKRDMEMIRPSVVPASQLLPSELTKRRIRSWICASWLSGIAPHSKSA